MVEKPAAARRVVVLDSDDARRAATCALLERAGYLALGGKSVHAVARHLDAPESTVLVFDVSLPRSWRQVMDDHATLRLLVDERCPIVLHGIRPEDELAELDWACRASAHVPARPDGRQLVALLRRLMPASSAPPPLPTQPPSGPNIPAVTRAAPKLLLVDDSEMTLEIMQSFLTAVGFDVRIAVALGEIRSIVAGWLPSVIVADVKRPDIRGDELCARLKASVDRSNVIVLLCSSLPDSDLAELARQANADGYVSKSQGVGVFVEQLAWQVRRLLRSSQPSIGSSEVR